MSLESIAKAVRDVPDFPKPGIVFKDISPVLQQPEIFNEVIDRMCEPLVANPPDVIVAIDARGFIFGAAVAYKLKIPLSLVRKKGKLPWKCVSTSYDLEYGSNEVEMHEDAFAPGARVLLIDDVLATGGTARAAADLCEKVGGKVESVVFFMELGFLNGRAKFEGYDVRSLVVVE